MAAVARVGDLASHPGAIASGSPTVKANGLGVARQVDTFNCDIHGPGQSLIPITTKTEANGSLIITVGAQTGCGATITSGSPNVNAE